MDRIIRFTVMVPHNGIQLQAELGPGDFFSSLLFLDVLAEYVAGNSYQPRTDGIGPGQLFPPQIAAEKGLLA